MTRTSTTDPSLLRSGAYKRFQFMAWVTGALLAFMTVLGLPWKYLLGNEGDAWYAIGWQLHGFLYMAYLLTVLDVAIRGRWSPGRTVAVGLAGTVPFMSFVFERRITHQLRSAAAAAPRPRRAATPERAA